MTLVLNICKSEKPSPKLLKKVMNTNITGTGPLYALHEQILLPVMGGLAVVLVCVSMYFFSRRFGKPKEGETFKQKLYIVQSLVSAFLIGQIIGHTTIFIGEFPATFGYLFILGGLLFLRLVESIGRAWNPVKGDRLTQGSDKEDDFDINRNTMEQESYISMEGIGSKEAAEQEWKIQDRRRSLAKRQWMLAFLVAALTVVSIMNGFLMIYRVVDLKIAIIICFIVNNAVHTITVVGASIHAGYHVIEDKKWRIMWWVLLGLYWLSVVVCSTIPVLIGMNRFDAAYYINTPYFSSIYLFAIGCLLRLSYYYEKHLYVFKTRKEVILDGVVFTTALAISAVTGFWL